MRRERGAHPSIRHQGFRFHRSSDEGPPQLLLHVSCRPPAVNSAASLPRRFLVSRRRKARLARRSPCSLRADLATRNHTGRPTKVRALSRRRRRRALESRRSAARRGARAWRLLPPTTLSLVSLFLRRAPAFLGKMSVLRPPGVGPWVKLVRGYATCDNRKMSRDQTA